MAASKVSCCVCDDSPAYLNYGAIVCGGCRVFFYRSIKNSRLFTCRTDGRCQVSAQKGRGKCPSCRFQRCLEMKMDPSLCKRSCNNVVVTDFCEEFINQSMLYYHSLITTHSPAVIPSSIETIQNCQMQSMNWYGGNPNATAYSNINISLWHLLENPDQCSSRETACIDITSSGNFSAVSYCRWLISFVDLLYQTHYFRQLPSLDQIKMAQNGIIDYIVLTKLQFTIASTVCTDECFLKQQQRFKPTVTLTEMHKRVNTYSALLAVIRPILKEFVFDDFEMTAMKSIAVFSPTCEISSLGLKISIFAKEAFTTKLGEYIANTRPELTRSEQMRRVQAAIQVTREIKKSTRVVAAFYTEAAVKNYDGMYGLLTHELHVKIF